MKQLLGATTPFTLDNSTDQGAFASTSNVQYAGGLPSFADAAVTIPQYQAQLSQSSSGGTNWIFILLVAGAAYWYFVHKGNKFDLSKWTGGLL
jgi:hypothetical protein